MTPAFTLEHYRDFFVTEGFFNPNKPEFLTPSVFIRTLWTTFRFTITVMAICLILAYPLAYFLSMQVEDFKWQLALFLLAMVPFWTSYLIRAVSWLPMLGRHGLINEFLLDMGAIDEPVSFFLYSEFSYTMALVQLYVVLAVGPIFFSLAKIDRTLLEAARDMGATPFQIFREIIAPLSLPGVAIGMIFIFVMLMGEFATAVVVYGGKTSTTGTVILSYYAIANYPFAAVNAFMLMLAMMIGVVIILRLVDIRKELSDGALDAGTSPQGTREGGLQRLLRDFSDLRLRTDVRDVHAVLPGAARRRDIPDARPELFWWEKLTGPSAVGDLKARWCVRSFSRLS